MSDTPWIVAVMGGVEPEEMRPHLHCERCGERAVTTLPLRIETYVEMSRGFIRAHASCKNVRDAGSGGGTSNNYAPSKPRRPIGPTGREDSPRVGAVPA